MAPEILAYTNISSPAGFIIALYYIMQHIIKFDRNQYTLKRAHYILNKHNIYYNELKLYASVKELKISNLYIYNGYFTKEECRNDETTRRHY